MTWYSCVRLIVATALLCTSFGAAIWASDELRMMDNAALYYLRAAASLKHPTTPEEWTTLDFIENSLPALPPSVFIVRTEALHWLVTERALLDSLAAAESCSYCIFPSWRKDRLLAETTHHAPLLRAAQRALAVAKALEYGGNHHASAKVYASVLRLATALGSEPTLDAIPTVGGIVQAGARDLEGFLARKPPASATTALLQFFDERRGRILPISAALRREAARTREVLQSDPSQALQYIERLYGEARSKPAVDRLIALAPKDRSTRLMEWLADYVNWVEQVAAAAEQRYARAISQLRKMDKERDKLLRDPMNSYCPLIPLLLPEITPLYQRSLLTEGQFRALHLLTAATLYHAQTGSWPKSLAQLHPLLKAQSLPKDPFTDQPIHYTLIDGQPAITIRVPHWIARDARYIYEFSFADRLYRDQRISETHIRMWQQQLLSTPRKE